MIKLTVKIPKRMDMLVVIYALIALTYQVLYLLAPIKAFFNLSGLNILSSVIAVLGALLLAVDFFSQRICLKARYSSLLFVTLVVLGISSVIHMRYGISGNLKVLIWQAVQMLLIYSAYKRLSLYQMYHVILGTHTAFSVIFVPAVIVSLIQFLRQHGYELIVDHLGGTSRQGFLEGRLFGLFSSVHFVGVFLAVLIIGACYFACKTKRVFLKVLYIFECVLFLVYIVLSGTRSIVVALIFVVFAVSFMVFNRYVISFGKKWAQVSVTFCLSLCAAVVAFLLIQGVTIQLKKIPMYIAEKEPQQSIESIEESVSATVVVNEAPAQIEETTMISTILDATEMQADNAENQPSMELKRDDIGIDISNNRFKIWKEYLFITSSNISSLLFGNSPGEYMKIIRDNYPDSYIVAHIRNNYPQMYAQNLIYDTHNGYLSVFVTGGILCSIVFGAFLVLMAIKFLKCVFSKCMISCEITALTASMIIIVIATFFDSDVFFKCNSTSLLFWLLLGSSMKVLDNNTETK